MPMGTIKFRPGINTQMTPALNEGGWSDSSLIRFHEGEPEKIGGWDKYYPFSLATSIRHMKEFQSTTAVTYLGLGGDDVLGVISGGVFSDITPQIVAYDLPPDIETTSGSAVVNITDSNVGSVTDYDFIYFNTPISVGGLILEGTYRVLQSTGTGTYQITAAQNATATVSTVSITGATQANPCEITATSHGRSNGDLVYIDGVSGMTELNGGIYTVANASANTFELSGVNSTGYTAYSTGGSVYGGIVPQFTTSSGSEIVTVVFPGHGLSVGNSISFDVSTSVGGVTISGTYEVLTVPGSGTLTISASAAASSSATSAMNSGEAEIKYYVTLGPNPPGAGYGIGAYGSGNYGTGVIPSAQTGNKITATDWSLDSWQQTLIACPEDGALYAWSPTAGLVTARLLGGSDAPLYNKGCFIAQPANILVAYGSTTRSSTTSIGVRQDPLLIRWSDQDNYEDWSLDTTDQVGSVRLPRGSEIRGGIQGPNQALIWTDVAVWSMQYVGQPLVFTFNEIATNCGLIGRHAQAILGTTVYWMGHRNFFALGPGGVQPLPCTVWDSVFQDLDTSAQSKCWAWGVSSFNEVWFFYPSLDDGTGECSRYVKMTLQGNAIVWDKGVLSRSSGIGQSIIDYPLATAPGGIVYRHESGVDADGQPINAWVQSGEVLLNDGTDCLFVDQIRPDMRYGLYGQPELANMAITVTATNDFTGASMSSGAMPYTTDTNYLSPRVRGHRVSIKIESNDVSSWWRMGRMRYRAAPDGRV